jgi:hypothetical protein
VVVTYEETPLPPDPAYAGLWRFLRAGGFDAFNDTEGVVWKGVVGRPPRGLEDHVREVLALALEKGGGGGEGGK